MRIYQTTVEQVARAIHDLVAEHEHGDQAGSYEDLDAASQYEWERVATHALEGAADRVIETGRPIWWVDETRTARSPVTRPRPER